MVTIPRNNISEVFRRAEAGGEEALAGHFLGESGVGITVRELGVGGPAGGLTVVGKFRSRPGGPALPTPEDSAGLRPGWFLMLVSVEDGCASEWACWTTDGKSPDALPLVVRLVEQ